MINENKVEDWYDLKIGTIVVCLLLLWKLFSDLVLNIPLPLLLFLPMLTQKVIFLAQCHIRHSLHDHPVEHWYDFYPSTNIDSFNPAPHLMALTPWFRELGLCSKAISALKQSNCLSTKKKGAARVLKPWKLYIIWQKS